MARIATLLAVAALAAGAAHAQLAETEQRVVAAVKERSPAALQLLERAVRINSGTLNVEGVREVGKLFAAELDGLGFKTRWVEVPAELKRAGHLVAAREGTQGKRVLLLGHIDTVFEKNSPVIAWDPRGTRVRGQGVNDMKGGDVVIVEALRALQKVGALDNTTITVVLTGDEERPGKPIEQARAALVEAAKRSDLALSFESGVREGGQYRAVPGRRSSGLFVVEVTATAGHSARVFTEGLGYGAIFEGARILESFRANLIEPGLTFNAGIALGGTDVKYDEATATGTAYGKTNVIPKSFRIEGNLRYASPEQGEKVRSRMREIVAASLPGAASTIGFSESYPPMAPSEGNLRLLDAYSKASVDAGLGPIGAANTNLRGAGDVQFAAPYVPGLDGLGTTGSGAHSGDETLEIDSLERSTIRAAILIYRLTR
jgi:glutamate carboxypeptidase